METIVTRDVSIPRLGFGTFRMLTIGLDDEDRAAVAALPKDRRCVRPPFAPDWNALTL
jgi:hypothetical protein